MNTKPFRLSLSAYRNYNLPLPLPSQPDRTLALFLNSSRSTEYDSVQRRSQWDDSGKGERMRGGKEEEKGREKIRVI